MDENTRKKGKFLINVLFYVTIALLVFVTLKYVASWVLPFIIAFFVALVIEPVVKFLQEKCRFKRSFAAVVCTLLFWAVASTILIFAASTLIRELSRLLSNLGIFEMDLSGIIESIKSWLQGIMNSVPEPMRGTMNASLDTLPAKITDFIASEAPKLISMLSSTLFQVPTALLFMLITVVASCFFSIDLPVVKVFIMRQIPVRHREAALGTRGFFGVTLFKLFKAYALILLITFTEVFLGLYVLGIEYAFTLAILIALCDIMPVLGTGTVLIPWSVINLVTGNIKLGVGLLVLYLAITIIRQIIEPKIVGKQVGINPVATLLAMYVGVQIFGVSGIVLFPLLLFFLKYMQDNGHIKIWEDVDEEEARKLNLVERIISRKKKDDGK